MTPVDHGAIVTRMTAEVAIAGQMDGRKLAAVKALGYRAVISVRLDGEDDNPTTAQQMAAATEAVGLAFAHVPVRGSLVTADAKVAAFGNALAQLSKPVVAFCATGTRAAILWGLNAVGILTPAAVLAAWERAGFDLDFLEDDLAIRHARVTTALGTPLRALRWAG